MPINIELIQRLLFQWEIYKIQDQLGTNTLLFHNQANHTPLQELQQFQKVSFGLELIDLELPLFFYIPQDLISFSILENQNLPKKESTHILQRIQEVLLQISIPLELGYSIFLMFLGPQLKNKGIYRSNTAESELLHKVLVTTIAIFSYLSHHQSMYNFHCNNIFGEVAFRYRK